MTLLFIKRLNDIFEKNAERLIKEGKSEKEAHANKGRRYRRNYHHNHSHRRVNTNKQ